MHIRFGYNEDENLLAQRKREIAQLTESLGKRDNKEMSKNRENSTLTAVLGDFTIINAEQILSVPESNVAKN